MIQIGKNNLDSKICRKSFLYKEMLHCQVVKMSLLFFLGAKMQALLDPSNLESAVQLATKLDDSIEEISLKVRVCT